MISARDIAGAPRARATSIECLVHRGKHGGMLTHAEVVVGAPYSDFTGTTRMMMRHVRKSTRLAFEIGKNTIPPLATEIGKLPPKMVFAVHDAGFP
jgi:hypothetical protein